MESNNLSSKIDEIILRFLKDGITLQEKTYLKKWMEADDANKDYFRQLYMVWKSTGIDVADNFNAEIAYKKVYQSIFGSGDGLEEIQETKPFKVRSLVVSSLRWTAVIFISLCAGALIHYLYQTAGSNPLAENSKNEIIVPLGSKSKILLPDHTEVWLNAGSRLTYTTSYGKTLREVNLVGEAYFKVAKMESKPFIVHTSRAQIKAIGTEFNVKAYPDEKVVETILVKGVVVVRKTTGQENVKDFTAQNSVLLKPGQKIQIFKENDTPISEVFVNKNMNQDTKNKDLKLVNKIANLETSKIEVETSWKESRWIIEGMNLSSLFVELGRRFNVSITLTDSSLTKYQFSGIIQSETLEQVFNLMSLTIPFSYTIDKGKVEITLNPQLENKYKRAYK